MRVLLGAASEVEITKWMRTDGSNLGGLRSPKWRGLLEATSEAELAEVGESGWEQPRGPEIAEGRENCRMQPLEA